MTSPSYRFSIVATPAGRDGRDGRSYDHAMPSTPQHWTARHFSQANPAGPGCDSAPALLRRLAESIEELGPAEIQHIVIESEPTEHGPWWSGTVYFHLPEDDTD